jgi:hypothetical protein
MLVESQLKINQFINYGLFGSSILTYLDKCWTLLHLLKEEPLQQIHLTPLKSVGKVVGTINPTPVKVLPYLQAQFDLDMCLTFEEKDVPLETISNLPDPKAWSERLAIGIAEVLIGDRPPYQLIRWLAFDVYCTVERKAIKHRHDSRRVRPLLRCVHVSKISDSVFNVSAVIQKGIRGRAMSLRLVAETDRWRCTELLVA